MKVICSDFEIEYGGQSNCQKIREAVYGRIASAARTCYKSEQNASPEADEKLILALVRNGHEAMLEHAYLTVRFTVDRGVANELVRHRVASFAQESTRYCNYSAEKFANQIVSIDLRPAVEIFDETTSCLSRDQQDAILNEWREACADAEKHYMTMLAMGATPQIARSVLNLSTKTELVMTANLREWRHILMLRALGTTGAPHPQMREIMGQVLFTMAATLPAVFGDIAERYRAKYFLHMEVTHGEC